MNTNSKKISAVPTNIITGFLGVGKSTAILHLLNHKPVNERWAILVNEFGEIGVDGSLYEGHYTEEQGVFIREVPGGCMCCAAGLPMQVALNQLLKKAKPDRLLIEPTGLGHPKEVLQTLTADSYSETIALQKTITLVDARNLSDRRYTEHEIFNQQIAIADIVVGNKQDLYQDGDEAILKKYVKQYELSEDQVVFTQQGNINDIDLSGKSSAVALPSHHHHHHDHQENKKPLLSDVPLPGCGYIKAMNKGEGYSSIGWRFSKAKQFSYKKLSAFLNSVAAERIKGVFMTDKGIVSYNFTADTLMESTLDNCTESRIEIIATEINEQWSNQLMACIFSEGS